MAEPKVEFRLDEVKEEVVREVFDQLRRWHEFREDENAPAVRTISQKISSGAEENIYVPGNIYGAIGFTERDDGTWKGMLHSIDIAACYFTGNYFVNDGNFVRVANNTAQNKDLQVRLTIFYRDK